MAYCNMHLFACVTFTSYWVTSALFNEGIVTENMAEPHEFTYQVAIMGKLNYTDVKSLICGGGIIAPNKILSAAQCFVDENGIHRRFTYSIIADSINLYMKGGIEMYIDLIFLVSNGSFFINDISVAQLIGELDININPHLSQLRIANAFQDLESMTGSVAGYGYHWVRAEYITEEYDYPPIFRRVAGGSDRRLRYLEVIIRRAHVCRFGHLHPDAYKQFCGLALDVPPGQMWGICEKDAGSPLVVNGVIAGVVSSSHSDCDDTYLGGLYTNVSAYEKFISAIIIGHPLNNTIIYYNRPHKLKW